MIHVRELNSHYDNNHILKDVSFDVPKGTVTTIIGPSGSGKTSLLRTLNALKLPSSGEIEINNFVFNASSKITKKDVTQLRDHSSMVFQNYNLFKNKTVLENVTEGLIYGQNMEKQQAIDTALPHLEQVGLIAHKDKYPAQLSGGQSQRVGIVRALALHKKILLLDEPTSSLDVESIKSILELIKSIAKQGITMVLVTHEIQFAKQISDQILFIDDGQIIERGTPQAVLEESQSPRVKKFLNQINE
ncbi:amino acid ABC transporter ATP-binding protein [Staphylococcus massiliensis]|uniref:Polar amino acid ABC transporter ATPase n=1 Tax=Staphylococcus massiliensis S46 TaxID=1229783 RepID=K9ANU5_9STAP|nr:amino acid ABC transporter ATP-binding protein [Staphylococcus massiliensis]EKU48964.1 polar amino acid ABC transporter ATPase [Staphylococcus massiliensis S46]MCG3399404.1 amino acid ABC transporter ATP-binding protein [Staphylococcus massiliensis]MCG3402495.1 amino acid ABC transporter ATP-binding protein [Staphylococcus massiliensis]MCG3411540.1 amino acid ABC transporter ATP-binding protein [Staphylococcus massiliensis]PNZ98754.1 amino acid ABC transporter ATP-binding protein [Staphyloc